MESTSIVLNRSRIRFSDIQLEEIAKRNFTGQHYTVIDIQPLLLFLLFYAIIDSSVTSPHKSLLITPQAYLLNSLRFSEVSLSNTAAVGEIKLFFAKKRKPKIFGLKKCDEEGNQKNCHIRNTLN